MVTQFKKTSIHYSITGEGKCVVLLHGFLLNTKIWSGLIPLLSKKNKVLAIDLPGHGKSDCIDEIHSMELLANLVNFILEENNITSANLLGHSMGGYVALAFAEKKPENLKGLCLMNSTSRADSDEKKTNRDRAIEAVKNNYKTFVRISVSNLFKPSNRLILTKEIKEVTKEALKTPLQGIVAALEGMKNRPDRETLLSETSFKKMMIIGKEDPALDYNSLIEQTQNSDIKVVEFPDGHMSHIENIKEFTYNILHFIEK